MDSDAVGAGQFREGGGRHRVRLVGTSGLADGRHMIHINSE
jgi:hypothetical protein